MANGGAAGVGVAEETWFGHPRALMVLFFTEMWERFSYYGMRAILILFMTSPVAIGGLGWPTETAGPVYGLYTSMVYLTSLPGGWIADRLIGPRRAVLVGAILIASGHVSLMFHAISTFYFGLFLIVLGTGLLKPNISVMVGELYTAEDKRRDAGFSIFYMGINLGALLAPFVCGFFAQKPWFREFLSGLGIRPESSWHWGFGAAAVGMALGIVQYVVGGRRLGTAGLRVSATPEELRKNRRLFWVGVGAALSLAAVLWGLHASGTVAITVSRIVRVVGVALIVAPAIYFGSILLRPHLSKIERRRVGAVILLFLFATLFWSAFEQAGSTLNLFAERHTRNELFGLGFPSSWFQSVNSIFLVLLAPCFAWLWVRLKDKEPSSPAKFGFGLFGVGFGYLILAIGAVALAVTPRVSPMWLLMLYFFHSAGELCLSPVGLSGMTKLAPDGMKGEIMGIWFMSISLGNFAGGQVAGLFESFPIVGILTAVGGVSVFFAIVAAAMIKPIRRLMGGVH